MLAAAPHRGDKYDSVNLGSAVLATTNRLDLNDAFLARSDRFICAFVGCLDNDQELRASIVDPRAGSTNPAATTLGLFEAAQDRIWGRLRGDYAVIISDGQKLWVSRDHLGSSTAFFRVDGSGTYVASEAKQVVAGAGIPREPNFDCLHRAIFGEDEPYFEPTVMIAGVERIPRASYAVFRPGLSPLSTRYWDPAPLVGAADINQREAEEQLLVLLKQAGRRSVSGRDVVALSGGIDSPVVAATAAPVYRELTGRSMPALSTVYPHAPTVDETPYIEAVVEQLGLDWHSFVPEYESLSDLTLWTGILDGPLPTADISAIAEFFSKARELGARTVLMGELAELVFDIRQHVVGHLLLHGRWPTAWRHMRGAREKGRRWRGVVKDFAPSLAPPWIVMPYVRWRARDAAALASWLDPAMVPGLDRRWDLERPARARHEDVQLYFAMAPSLTGIEASNICAAYYGLHLRRPLIDRDLWEFFLSLPAQIKFPDHVRKSLVRETMRGRVPDTVLDRTDKTGFTEDVLGRIDFEALRNEIFGIDFHLKGVNYAIVADRLEQRDVGYEELVVLNRLAGIHAFVASS